MHFSPHRKRVAAMATENDPTPTEYYRVVRHPRDEGFSLPRLQLRERRAAGSRPLFWVFQRHLECILYNREADGGSSGAIWKLMNQCGLGSTALKVNPGAVTSKQITNVCI